MKYWISEDMLKNSFQEEIDKAIKWIAKKWESNILNAINSTKTEIISEQSIIEWIKALQWFDKKQAILLNKDIQKQFCDLICWDSILPLQWDLQTLMWVKIYLYNGNNFNIVYNNLLKKIRWDYLDWLIEIFLYNR